MKKNIEEKLVQVKWSRSQYSEVSRSDIADPSPIRPGQKVTLTQSYLDEMYYVLQRNYFYVVLLNRCKNKSLKRYFAEAIYRDDVPHALRYIVLAIYPRNDVSLERCIVGTRSRRKVPISRRFIVLKVSRKSTIYRKNKAR